jgi:hypothetical protein
LVEAGGARIRVELGGRAGSSSLIYGHPNGFLSSWYGTVRPRRAARTPFYFCLCISWREARLRGNAPAAPLTSLGGHPRWREIYEWEPQRLYKAFVTKTPTPVSLWESRSMVALQGTSLIPCGAGAAHISRAKRCNIGTASDLDRLDDQ